MAYVTSGKPFFMSKDRPVRGSTSSRRVTLPHHFWLALDEAAKLQSEAYQLMGGVSRYTVSDLLESGAQMHLQSMVAEFGDFPTTQEDRKSFVKRLAESNKKSLMSQLLKKS